jgi:spore maturation protein CgeB
VTAEASLDDAVRAMGHPGRRAMLRLARDEELRARLAESGLETIRSRHSCAHRAEQLEAIHAEAAAFA